MLKTRKRSRFHTSINAATVLGVIGIAVVIAYSAYVTLPFFQGPSIDVAPLSEVTDGTFLIQGTTKRVSALTINELAIPLAEDGSFAVERAYPEGYTVVIITASDRFGRSKSETLSFITHHASKKENDREEDNDEERSESVVEE